MRHTGDISLGQPKRLKGVAFDPPNVDSRLGPSIETKVRKVAAKQDEDGWSTETKVLIRWSAAAMFGALVVMAGGAIASYWLMTGSCIFDTEGRRPKDVSDAIRIGLTLAAGGGAAVALVVAFRRQKVLEEDREGKRADDAADREVQRALHDRYQSATAQLGHDNHTIRLAGVFALAAVADDWLARIDRGQAQVCIDVLCSYLRTDERVTDRSQPDLEVRQTITRVVAAHLQANASRSWGGLDFDFTGASFTGTHDFSGAVFSGGSVSFDQASFTGDVVSFNRAVFSGGVVSFARAKFSSGYMTFLDTAFSGGEVNFLSASFSGTEMVFFRSKFSGAEVVFSHATVDLSQLRIMDAEISKGQVNFDGVKFKEGGGLFVVRTKFSGGEVTFRDGLFGPVEPADGGGVVTGPWPGPPDPLPKVYPLPADNEQE